MRYIISIICLAIGFNADGQIDNNSESNFEIDENIKSKVEEVISESELKKQMGGMFLIYENQVFADYYENDSLSISMKDEKRKMLFKSFFYSHNDTLSIDGAYGLFGGFGFSIKFIDKQSIVYHMLAGDDFPIHSKTKDGELEFRIEVPCTKTKVILSKFPELKEEEIIYGLVEFESEPYYISGPTVDGKEIEERKKVRMDMKIFFKSKFMDLEKMN